MMLWTEYSSAKVPDPDIEQKFIVNEFEKTGIDIAVDDDGVAKFIEDYCAGTMVDP